MLCVCLCFKSQELEQIEDTWKTEARHQRDRIDHLEEENHRLNLVIRDKTVDDKLQAGMMQHRPCIQCQCFDTTYHNLGFIPIYSHTLFSTLFFHSLSLLIESSVLAITTKSSAYNSSQGKATLNSLDMASVTITDNSGLNANLGACQLLPQNHYYYHKLF